jgi:hypothetical protein
MKLAAARGADYGIGRRPKLCSGFSVDTYVSKVPAFQHSRTPTLHRMDGVRGILKNRIDP